MRDATWVRHPLWYRLALEDAFRSFRPGFHRAPLLGFSKIAPPSTWAARVNSCAGTSVGVGHFGARASARPCQGSSPVPPSRFLAVLVVCSACCLAGLLHPAADPGVRRVSGRPFGSFRFRRVVPFPSTPPPFEAFPLSAAVPLSRAHAFLPFAFRKSGRFDFKALLHGSSPPRQKVLPPAVARCFLGLFFYETRKRVHLFRHLRRALEAAVPWGLVLSHVPPALGLLAKSRDSGFGPCDPRPWPGRWCGCRCPCRSRGNESCGRFISVSVPLCSGCKHSMQGGKSKGGWPLPVAGGHDAGGSGSR